MFSLLPQAQHTATGNPTHILNEVTDDGVVEIFNVGPLYPLEMQQHGYSQKRDCRFYVSGTSFLREELS